MTAWRAALLMGLFVAAADCRAADEVNEFSDSQLTREQWQQRLEEAKRRTESFVTKARGHPSEPFISEQEQRDVADQRAMRDQTLQEGDIVSTSRGFLIYTGRANDEAGGPFRPLAPIGEPPGRSLQNRRN